MYATKTISIYGVSNGIAHCEAKGLGKCLIAYAENASGEDIMQIGFNANSGYTYIALENGVQICSMLGRDVEFMRDNPEDGEEVFFDSYREAEEYDFDSSEDEDEDEDEDAQVFDPEPRENSEDDDSDDYPFKSQE